MFYYKPKIVVSSVVSAVAVDSSTVVAVSSEVTDC
jgi:hypothetical protein